MIRRKKEDNSYFVKFWSTSQSGKINIRHLELIKFLEQKGYVKLKAGNEFLLGKVKDNVIYVDCPKQELIDLVRNHLEKINEMEVLEVFTRGIGNYLSNIKLDLLRTVEYSPRRDLRHESWIVYKNCAVKIEKNSISVLPHNKVPFLIHSSEIINRNYKEEDSKQSDFYNFMLNVSGKDPQRLKSLMTSMGYLLHKCQDPSIRKVTILLDKEKSANGKTNGRTGKSLIIKALREIREVERFNGKNMKEQSVFQLQRLKRTTDIMAIDDLRSGYNIESLYNYVSDEICIEKKGKDEFCIDPELTPKMVVTSNFYVKGPGGSSDRDRRNEFELDNYYSDSHKPIDDFGKEFFSGWNDKDWNQYDTLMIDCIRLYLKEGLIVADSINLEANNLKQATSAEFYEYSKLIAPNKWLDKREELDIFNSSYPDCPDVSSNLFTRWLKEYASQKNLEYKDKSSGGVYKFILKTLKSKQNEQ